MSSILGSKRVIALLTELFRAAYIPVPDYWPAKFPGWREPFLVEYLSREGKLLRPLLFLTGYIIATRKKTGQTGNPTEDEIRTLVSAHPEVMDVAVAFERFHCLLMALDDILDGGTERRGGKALHVLFQDWAGDVAFRRDDGQYLGKASSRAFVIDIAFAASSELFQTLLRATGSTGTAVCPRGQLDTLPLVLNLSRRAYSDRGETVPLDYMLYYLSLLHEAIKLSLGFVQSTNCREVLSLFVEMLQATLEGEWTDVEWAGGTGSIPGEERIRRIYGRLEGLHNWPTKPMPSLKEILENQFGKTSFYSITFPLLAGMLLADSELPKEVRRPVEDFSAAFGRAFQINDDLLVTVSDASGKSALTDLKRGSKTAVTVGVYELLSTEEKERWVRLLERCKKSAKARREVMRVIEASGVKTLCTRLIATDLGNCREALARLSSYGCWVTLLDWLTREGVAWMDDARVAKLEESHG